MNCMVKLKVPNWLGGSQNISHDVNVRKKGGKNRADIFTWFQAQDVCGELTVVTTKESWK